jgi:MFS family permease
VNPSGGEGAPAKHDPLQALRQTSFILFTSSRGFSVLGLTLLNAVIAWQVYEISGSALNLGLLGLAQFIPALCVSLIGGAAADTYNRRNIVLIAQCVPLTCATILCIATIGDWVRLELIYGLVLFIGMANAFEAPARAALLPIIVRPETFANAVTVSSTIQTIGAVSGPALAGGIIAVAGIAPGFAVYAGFTLVSMLLLSFLKVEHVADKSRGGINLTMVRDGIRYVRSQQVILGAMSLDMFAVIFGGATALLPIYASDILKVGPAGYGILQGSFYGGAFFTSLFLVFRPQIDRTGRTLLYAVALFSIATILFGISRNFYLSLALYTMIGAIDRVSVVMRQTTIQLATPDELRGRVSAVNQTFIGASNQVGAMESGFLAALTSATFAVTSGGFLALAITGLIRLKLPLLWSYRVSDALRATRAQESAEPTAPPATQSA